MADMNIDVREGGATPVCALPALIDPLRFEGKPVRVVIQDDEPWFVAADVCRILEIEHAGSALRVLDQDEKGVRDMHTLGGDQKLSIISEPGLYKLIGRSRKPEAKRFDRWVRHEVLPSIRRTGGYVVAAPEESPEIVMARGLLAAQAALERRDTIIAAMQPKVEALDRIATADGSLSLTEAAKALQVRPKGLIGYMLANGWIYRRAGSERLLGYQSHTSNGDLEHKVTTVLRPDGSEKVTEQVRVTAQGLTKLAKLMPGRLIPIEGGRA